MDISKEQIIRLKNNDMTSFDEIYEIARKSVYFTIALIVKDNLASEDIMQEVFIDLLMNKSKSKEDDNLGALLTTSAKNKAINYYNRHKRETQYINTLQDESYDQEIGLDSGLLDKIRNILSKKEYEVFILHILGEYSFKEISEIKKIPLGTLTWTYQEARKKLEIELGGKNHDW